MSHFLQRIARSTARPQNHLNPMLGSVYAPAAVTSAFDLATYSEVFARAADPIHEPTHAAFRPSSQSTVVGDEGIQSRPFEHQPFAQNPFGTQLLFPGYMANEPLLSPSGAPNSKLQGAENVFTVDHSDLAAEPAPKKVVERSEAVTSTPTPARQPGLHPHVLLPTPIGIRRSSNQVPQQDHSAQREPDEIHIHIGRIEVAAISQPVSRTASAPASRRSINLGDYLQNGNGRGR